MIALFALIVNFIATSLQPVINNHSSLYADVNGFPSPSIITGDTFRSDLLSLPFTCQVPVCLRTHSSFSIIMDYGLRTTDYGLGIKRGLGYKTLTDRSQLGLNITLTRT